MKRSLLFGIVVFTALAPATSGCSSVDDLGGTTTVYCSAASEPATSCTIVTGPSAGVSTIQSNCTGNGGKVVASCPTSKAVGCCTLHQEGVTTETCTYSGETTTAKRLCDGEFTTSS